MKHQERENRNNSSTDLAAILMKKGRMNLLLTKAKEIRPIPVKIEPVITDWEKEPNVGSAARTIIVTMSCTRSVPRTIFPWSVSISFLSVSNLTTTMVELIVSAKAR